MEERMKKIKEKLKELKMCRMLSIEDIDEKPPTQIDKRIIKIYEEIWTEVLQICQEEQIKYTEKFDEKYSLFEYGLEDFIENYTDMLDYCVQMDKEFLELELKMLEQAIAQFELDEDVKQDFELLSIRDRYLVGKKNEAEKLIKQWIKKHPSVGEGYETACDLELLKKKPDFEKIAEILDRAEENGTYVSNEEIYEQVINYFEDIGNIEMSEYFESLLDSAQQDDEFGIDFDEDDLEVDEEYEELVREHKQSLINEIKEVSNDKVEKNKIFEQYINEESVEKLLTHVGPQSIFNKPNVTKIEREEAQKYILENYKEILKENIKYTPKFMLECISKIPSTGIVEIDLNESTEEELLEFEKYYLLKRCGMAFMGKEEDKVTVVVPFIKEIKKSIKDKEILKENKEFNKRFALIKGICEVYGAITVRKVCEIVKKFYGDDEENIAKIIMISCVFYGTAILEYQEKTRKSDFIYHKILEQEVAKKIIKQNKPVLDYTEKQYLKFSEDDFVKNMKGYKKIEKEIGLKLFCIQDVYDEMLKEILTTYSIEIRLKEEDVNKIIEEFLEQCDAIPDIGFGKIDTKILRKGFEEISDELPKWL